MAQAGTSGLLAADEPPPVEWLNRQGRAPMLLVCDHASNRVPAALDGLGLSAAERERHIAWDIGAAEVARRLSARFDAPALFAGYSRLVVDCNRHPHDPAVARASSDGIEVPGNRGLDPAALARRVEALHIPYHAAISAALDAFLARGTVPLLLAVHSCTPQMAGGAPRPWHIGFSWARDDRAVRPMMKRLAAQPGLVIGDNQPYDLDPEEDYTVPVHALSRGLPHLQVEFRQDLIATGAGTAHWADIFAEALPAVLGAPHIHRLRPPTSDN